MTSRIFDYAEREAARNAAREQRGRDRFECGMDLRVGIAPELRLAWRRNLPARALGPGAFGFATGRMFSKAGIPMWSSARAASIRRISPTNTSATNRSPRAKRSSIASSRSRCRVSDRSSLMMEAQTATPARESIVRAACPHDCPDTCAMLITVREEGGKKVAIKIAGDPTHPTTAGTLCTKVSRYLERTYHPGRVLHPMKRVGAKGEGRFVRVSWQEALRDIAQRLIQIAALDPQRIVPYSYAGTMGLVQVRECGAFFSQARCKPS